MNLYKVERFNKIGYDEYDAFIIAASDESDARDIASGKAADEGRDVWRTSQWSVILIGSAEATLRRGVILGSFNAG